MPFWLSTVLRLVTGFRPYFFREVLDVLDLFTYDVVELLNSEFQVFFVV